jgi:hypothetical protein
MPLLLAAVLSLSGLAPVHAAPPAAEEAAFDRLVEQLGDSNYRQRDAATRRLEAAGVKALPALKRALTHSDPEVRRRASDLIPRIETAAVVAPRRVTLKMIDKPLRAIFDEMTKQTGFKIEFWTHPQSVGQKFSCDFRDMPFWPALDQLCHDANLVLQQTYGDERIVLQSQGGYTPHVSYEGAFRFVPTGFQMYRNLEFGLVGGASPAPQRNETLTLSFLVFSEPRLPLLGMGEVRLEAAYDADKNTMLPPPNPANAGDVTFFPGGGIVRRHVVHRYGNGNRSYMQQGQLTLHRPSERPSKVKLVRGVIPVTLLVEQKSVVVADDILKAKGKKSTIDTTTFHFDDVTVQANKQYQIKLNITEESKDNPNDWTWMNTLFQRIELRDDKGNVFPVQGTNWGNTAPNNVQMTLTYGPPANGKAGPPSKFMFQHWRTLQHQVRFEFKDLPLP